MTVSDSDDWPVQEARMAKAKAHHERTSLIGKWCNEGHITVMEDNDPVNIRLRIEDEFFAEPRDRFPSTTLIAKLQLAIHAGRSERNCGKNLTATEIRMRYQGSGNHASDAMLYGVSIHEMLEDAYRNVAKITATVKPPRRPRP